MNRDLSGIRRDYLHLKLDESLMDVNPIVQFKKWLAQAIEENENEPTAMTLSTVSSEGKPSGRIVLLKNVDNVKGFWFYTNYNSTKGQHLKHNPYAGLSFFWPKLERQVRITGKTEKLDRDENVKYFQSRPLDSRVSASISPQSSEIKSREVLEELFNERLKNAEHEPLACPENWGGYALMPLEIEFWQGRAGRLHDRILYVKENDSWRMKRLAP